MPPWIAEASLADRLGRAQPERAMRSRRSRKPASQSTEVQADVFKKKPSSIDKVVLLPFYYGFHVGLEVPEEDVYQMLNDRREERRRAREIRSSCTSQIAKDMVGIQRSGIASSVNLVPVHPGLAKYMREKGVWDAKWDARIAKK